MLTVVYVRGQYNRIQNVKSIGSASSSEQLAYELVLWKGTASSKPCWICTGQVLQSSKSGLTTVKIRFLLFPFQKEQPPDYTRIKMKVCSICHNVFGKIIQNKFCSVLPNMKKGVTSCSLESIPFPSEGGRIEATNILANWSITNHEPTSEKVNDSEFLHRSTEYICCMLACLSARILALFSRCS